MSALCFPWAFMGHLVDHFVPERSDSITVLCCNFEMMVSRQCCLSGCGFPPYGNVRLLLTFLKALRTMARTFLSHSVSLGCIPSSSLSVGERRFSATVLVGLGSISVMTSTCSLIEFKSHERENVCRCHTEGNLMRN